MATGLSPKLPIAKSYEDGWALNKTYKAMLAQNLKHLVLTNPGERMMDPNFGVGLRSFLFEQNTVQTSSRISARIKYQVEKYMPFIEITGVRFPNHEGRSDALEQNPNLLSVVIEYSIPAINTQDRISVITSAQNNTI